MSCYDCRYWARYPNQKVDKKKNQTIKGYCTYWKADKDYGDTCSGFYPIIIQR